MKSFKRMVMGGSVIAGSLLAMNASAESVTIGWFGGNWGEAFSQCVAEPFTKATGIRVIPEIGTSTVNLSKLEQQRSAPAIDAVWMDSGVSELAMASGVIDTLDPARIPDMNSVVPEGVYKRDGNIFAVSTGFYAVGIAYNTKELKTPPNSWNDLWRADMANELTFPSPANALGVPTVFFLNAINNQPGGMDATFKKLKALKASQFYDSSGAAANALQSGEVVAAVFNSAPTWDLNDRGLPLAFVAPKEGAWGGDVRLHLVKGARNKAAAEKFISAAITPEASACLAKKLYLGPSVKNVKVSPDVARKLPWGATGSVKDLKFLDWWEINKQRAALVDRWNREIAHK
ncbi:ABC transporter substrate-binding protein [Ralstonia syzygii]|uniref:Putative spermidine/putrescine-binding periplasmic protein (PotD) n=1 Tax=Ralstonia syzygii R24 TaxID=907261 RepID=G2ZZB2_9RALS|nr:ABC transporter substrate-binding protein [Ralstonia syzygii]CCA84210.1 putative spermidine/putrescine-binding periplasmic protein (potD) [Ralstonia syzygii R24]